LSRLKLSRYIAPHDPSNASGTVTLGMKVAQKLRRNRRMTSTLRMWKLFGEVPRLLQPARLRSGKLF
jgi:hypothetical protein